MSKRYRADQVGSFLRPPEIVNAHAALAEGKLTLEELSTIEDAAILRVLEMQREAGIDVYSDGEFRRRGWASNITDALDGYVEGVPSIRLQANMPRQAAPGGQGQGLRRVLGATVSKKHAFAEKDAAFLKENAGGPYKVTMPAPSYVVARAYNPEISDKFFGSRKALLTAVAELIREEIKVLVAAGVPYIQLDNPHYTDFVTEDIREQYRALGIDPDDALREDVEADNICYQGYDRSNVTLGMHLCRGNVGGGSAGGGGWHKSGGYENVAEIVFGGTEADALLLEYDSDRAGTFEPLRFMPKGKTAVLGLITTKVSDLETEDLILERLKEAGQYMDLDDATLSPQCGFASTFQGNPLTEDEQRKKLELVVNVARKFWSE